MGLGINTVPPATDAKADAGKRSGDNRAADTPQTSRCNHWGIRRVGMHAQDGIVRVREDCYSVSVSCR
jgi:hypothetical protein